MTTTHPAPQDTLLRLTRDVAESWASPARKGAEFTVTDYVPEDHPDGHGGPAYYIGNANGGYGNAVVPADAVEVARSAKAMKARRIPTAAAIREAMQSALLMDADGFECTETHPDGDHGVEVYGETHDGLVFAFTVQITSLYEGDA